MTLFSQMLLGVGFLITVRLFRIVFQQYQITGWLKNHTLPLIRLGKAKYELPNEIDLNFAAGIEHSRLSSNFFTD